MTQMPSLDNQVRRAGFFAAIACLLVTIPSLMFPLDAPGGFSAGHADRVAWLMENRMAFIAGWLFQIASMVTLTLVLMAFVWVVAIERPLRGMLAGVIAAASFVVFMIPKFIAVWTIPQLAHAVAAGKGSAGMADSLLLVLNVSLPFSLFTSFDYLGFWLYAVVGLMVAGPLMAGSTASKVCAVMLGAYGLLYHLVVFGVLAGTIGGADVEAYALSVAMLLIIAVLAAVFLFKSPVES